MIRKLLATPVAVLLMLSAAPAWADGLLYQLPDDGTWVEFEAKIVMKVGDQERDAAGQLRMASVGTAIEDGKPCRWIEFKLAVKLGENERVIVTKLLIPEEQLAAGKKPVENRVRGWIRIGDGNDVVALTDQNLGPLPGFLANPLTDVKPLVEEVVESPLGKLSCAGLTGRTEFAERNNINKAAFRIRRHERAPFGVVSSQMKVDVERDGVVRESLDMALTIRAVGKGAKSELPDHH